jgi:hypothetical protein
MRNRRPAPAQPGLALDFSRPPGPVTLAPSPGPAPLLDLAAKQRAMIAAAKDLVIMPPCDLAERAYRRAVTLKAPAVSGPYQIQPKPDIHILACCEHCGADETETPLTFVDADILTGPATICETCARQIEAEMIEQLLAAGQDPLDSLELQLLLSYTWSSPDEPAEVGPRCDHCAAPLNPDTGHWRPEFEDPFGRVQELCTNCFEWLDPDPDEIYYWNDITRETC